MRQHNGTHLETAAQQQQQEEDYSQIELERNYYRNVAEARARWLALLEAELKQIRHEQAYAVINSSADSARLVKSAYETCIVSEMGGKQADEK